VLPPERARTRCRERLEALAGSGLDLDAMRLEAVAELHRAVGFERWCALLVDPDTLVASRGIARAGLFSELPKLNIDNQAAGDLNDFALLSRSRDHVGVLSAASGGDLFRSRRWRDTLGPAGIGDELRVAAVDDRGVWADVLLFRDSDGPPFDAEDARLLRDVSPLLARALRRAAVAAAEAEPASTPGTGVLILGPDLRPRAWTGAARDWFEALNPARHPLPDGIPTHVWSVVGRLLAAERGEAPERAPRVKVRTGGASWSITEAARLDGPDAPVGGIAVTVRAASGDEVLDLLCRAHGLSVRERELVALLVEGLGTREIAARLFISRHTIQDHLKSIFDKVGVRTRHELVTGVFARAA
jgi:DNA-binding CsgD family transcriptional regulator